MSGWVRQTERMAWWYWSKTDRGRRLLPRYVTRSHLPDLLPSRLWQEGHEWLGGRLHFCVGHLESGHRTIEWKGNDWLVGYKPYYGAHHERVPNRFDDPDSYDADD